ncbi:MAG: 23S rRNA (uracil(1939)-C(5))-methyltransferase RlmD [Shewanella sp.]|nr:23S rRNA (uracil(1939)-C(5))-methyltransferase RlmD [Shewanella sp.]
MAQFFTAKPKKKNQISAKMTLNVTQLDHIGAGIAHHQGKIVFVPGALPGEDVSLQLVEQKKNFSKAKMIRVVNPSENRETPVCPHFDECGGCDLQHLKLEAQRQYKSDTLADLMTQHTPVQNVITSTLAGDAWHYRRRAKLATSYDKQTKKLNIGFRKLGSHDIVSINECPVLKQSLNILISPLAQMINTLKDRKTLGHIELIEGSNGVFVIIRTPATIADNDKLKLVDFANVHKINLQLQHESGFEILAGEQSQPSYALSQDVNLKFQPGGFVQVNTEVNQAMINQAIEWLELEENERVLDLFCGMGNFSLPIAKLGANVIGVEGIDSAVEQAKKNAQENGLDAVEFHACDLSADLSAQPWLGKIDKLLLDPARAGAYECLKRLKKLNPKRVVYVSCSPTSLARDTSILLSHGYQLQKLSMIDMFPQTHHTEAMALFVKK